MPAGTIDYRDSPTYWFVVLEIAREKGDYDRAAEAKRELDRLGVKVRYGKPKAERRGAVCQ